MNVYIFSGPTLSAADARAELDAIVLPPVSQGDVYRVARRHARAIGIIDGYFERTPAVWHKEILWAMAQGVHVFGSASMGALRAAELDPFGMVGVGWIFEAYRDGLLEDDDEVTVAHGSADSGYLAQSEAMVNIRQTLARAEAAGVIGEETHAALIALGKELFYPLRAYPALLRRGSEAGLPAADLDALRAWLPANRVNQKRDDARAMLAVMRDHLAATPEPKRVSYVFENTVWWDHAARYAGMADLEGADGADASLTFGGLLDELRLEPDGFRRAHDGATIRLLASQEAARRGYAADPAAVQGTADAFRRSLGLVEPADAERWLAENNLTIDALTELLREETLVGRARGVIDRDVTDRLPDYLRTTNRYGELAARARAKEQTLIAHGLDNPALDDVGLDEAGLFAWYFAHIGQPVPADLAGYVAYAGFGDADALRRAVLREYCYLRVREPNPLAPPDSAGICDFPAREGGTTESVVSPSPSLGGGGRGMGASR